MADCLFLPVMPGFTVQYKQPDKSLHVTPLLGWFVHYDPDDDGEMPDCHPAIWRDGAMKERYGKDVSIRRDNYYDEC